MLEGNRLSEVDNILPKALQFPSSPDAPRAQCDAEVFSFNHLSHSTCPGKVLLPQPSTHRFSQECLLLQPQHPGPNVPTTHPVEESVHFG